MADAGLELNTRRASLIWLKISDGETAKVLASPAAEKADKVSGVPLFGPDCANTRVDPSAHTNIAKRKIRFVLIDFQLSVIGISGYREKLAARQKPSEPAFRLTSFAKQIVGTIKMPGPWAELQCDCVNVAFPLERQSYSDGGGNEVGSGRVCVVSVRKPNRVGGPKGRDVIAATVRSRFA